MLIRSKKELEGSPERYDELQQKYEAILAIIERLNTPTVDPRKLAEKELVDLARAIGLQAHMRDRKQDTLNKVLYKLRLE